MHMHMGGANGVPAVEHMAMTLQSRGAEDAVSAARVARRRAGSDFFTSFYTLSKSQSLRMGNTCELPANVVCQLE